MNHKQFYATGQARLQIGVSPLSWVNEVLPEFGMGVSAEQCLSQARLAGYQGVEMSRIFPRGPAQLTQLLQRYQLSLISGWFDGFLTERSVEDELNAVEAHAKLLQACGCQVMVYGECGWMADNALDIPFSNRRLLPVEQRKSYAQKLTSFSQQLYQRYGLYLAYHHHLMMVAESFDEIHSIISQCGEEVGLLLDTGHAAAAGFNYQYLINEFASRICHIHLKDVRKEVLQKVQTDQQGFNDGVRRGMFTIPGDGCIDYQPLATFLHGSGYQGWIVVEAEQNPQMAPPYETVARAYQYVTQHILTRN
ncbi:myo-inosose-2 dehydratase [Providencia huaxiensis]|uniref:myo-inosose-2 dehydratase n=1 Tax=Providencia huaxiensis TaxID=2027290 RepID=UPI0034E5B2AD